MAAPASTCYRKRVLLPTADTVDRYLAIRGDHARLRPGVTALCERLGLHGLDVVRFTDGPRPAYAVGDTRVLKLYPGAYQDSYQVERRVLQAIHRRLPIPPQGWSTPASWRAGATYSWNACTASH